MSIALTIGIDTGFDLDMPAADRPTTDASSPAGLTRAARYASHLSQPWAGGLAGYERQFGLGLYPGDEDVAEEALRSHLAALVSGTITTRDVAFYAASGGPRLVETAATARARHVQDLAGGVILDRLYATGGGSQIGDRAFEWRQYSGGYIGRIGAALAGSGELIVACAARLNDVDAANVNVGLVRLHDGAPAQSGSAAVTDNAQRRLSLEVSGGRLASAAADAAGTMDYEPLADRPAVADGVDVAVVQHRRSGALVDTHVGTAGSELTLEQTQPGRDFDMGVDAYVTLLDVQHAGNTGSTRVLTNVLSDVAVLYRADGRFTDSELAQVKAWARARSNDVA